MNVFMKMLVLSLVVALGPAAALGVQIRPTSAQDGSTDGVNIDLGSGFGRYGSASDSLLTQVGIHSLGALTAADVASASLQIPQTDNLWTGNGDDAQDTETWTATHIDAADDTTVSLADASSASLGSLGLWRAPGPRATDGQRRVTYNVTANVIADLNAGRDSFAWRLDADSVEAGTAQMYFPTVDNVDGYFGPSDLSDTDNHGARLFITLTPEPATAGLMLIGGLGLLRRRRRSA